MLLRSAQLDYELAHHSLIWPMSEVVALVLLIMLVNDGFLIGVMFLAGTLGAWALFLAVSPTVRIATASHDTKGPGRSTFTAGRPDSTGGCPEGRGGPLQATAATLSVRLVPSTRETRTPAGQTHRG